MLHFLYNVVMLPPSEISDSFGNSTLGAMQVALSREQLAEWDASRHRRSHNSH
jgi:hypothetical protein